MWQKTKVVRWKNMPCESSLTIMEVNCSHKIMLHGKGLESEVVASCGGKGKAKEL